MAETATEAISGNRHFVWVSEIDGEVVAAVGAMSERSFWYERQQCSVMLYYTRVQERASNSSASSASG